MRDELSEESDMEQAIEALQEMYRERHAELDRVIAARGAMLEDGHPFTPDERRIWDKRGEQVEYLFGCLDGLANAIHALDPKLWGSGWRNFATWRESLPTKVAP